MKAYKYKLKTNAKFVAGCSATLNLCRELYNSALQERRDAWQINGLSINYHAQAVQLPQIKLVREDVSEVHSQVLQDALRRVDKAFDAFFRRCRKERRQVIRDSSLRPGTIPSPIRRAAFGSKATRFISPRSVRVVSVFPVQSKGRSRPA
ncbi:MAG TPA: helix-turn-helix domain-containing protein [Blastocatellia bacterium]|nr:helix-turn-helix domain-containing protein [Blastocatellia bacterium]